MEKKDTFPGYYLYIPLLMALFLYMTAITSTDLWNPDEPRYAEVAREMIEGGNYIQPYLNGAPYTEKPPLFFWTVIAGAKLFGGVNPFTVRLPSVLSALGTLALLIAFISEFFDRRKALLAAIILSIFPQFFWLARSGHIDMLLTFLITISLVSFYRWYDRGKYGYLIVFYLCLALATLAKGPVGMLLPIMVVLCFLMFLKEWGKIRKMYLYIGFPITIIIVLTWYFPATQQSSGYDFGPMVKRQIIGRISNPSSHCVSIFFWPFYYIESLAKGTLPWSLLVPSAVIFAYRSRRNVPLFFLFCWASVIFVFFTIIASKRSLYILPMYPAIAALVSLYVFSPTSTSNMKLVRVMSIFIGIAVLIVIAIAPDYLSQMIHCLTSYYDWEIIVPAVIASLIAIIAGVFGRKRKYIIGMFVVSMIILFTTISTIVLPRMNEYESVRSICDVYNHAKDLDSEIAMFESVREEYIFYTHSIIRTLADQGNLKDFFNSSKKRFCFVKLKDYKRALSNPDFPMYVVSRKRVSSHIMVLLCNQNISLNKKMTYTKKQEQMSLFTMKLHYNKKIYKPEEGVSCSIG